MGRIQDQENSSESKIVLIYKITRAEWTGGVAQAVEHLLCKCEAHPPKKEKNRRKIRRK
jgi:hypothetical protein